MFAFDLFSLDDDAGSLETVHFINVTSDDIAAITGHLPQSRVQTCGQMQTWDIVPIPRPPSMLDFLLDGSDQGSVLLLDYCTFTELNAFA